MAAMAHVCHGVPGAIRLSRGRALVCQALQNGATQSNGNQRVGMGLTRRGVWSYGLTDFSWTALENSNPQCSGQD